MCRTLKSLTMAFVGNDIFGHGMTHHPSSLVGHTSGGFGGSHGTGGFGSSAAKSTFGQGMGSSGFGMSGSQVGMNPNQQFFHRQNSLLTDMTHSKTDPKPVYVNQFNQSQAVHEGQMFSNMYEKPLEKPQPKPELKRRPTLTRQTSVSIPDSFDRPPKLSTRTRSMSLSMYPTDSVEPMKPMNMDVAKPILKRSSTVSEGHHKHRFLRPLSLGRKFRKRSDSRSSQSSTEPPHSEPPRSMRYHEEIETKDPPIKSRSSQVPLSPKTKQENEHEALILSLMNPPSSPGIESDYTDGPDKHEPPLPASLPHRSKQEPLRDEVIESPTTVRRRLQQVKPTDQDDTSVTSGRSTPKSVHVISTPSSFRSLTIEKPARKSHSPRRSPNDSPLPGSGPKTFNDYKPEVLSRTMHHNYQRSDSENSDTFYDCENTGVNERTTRKEKKRGKRKTPVEKSMSCKVSTGSCSDDESSNPNSPRSALTSNNPFHLHKNLEYELHKEDKLNDQYDDTTLCVRELINTFNRKAKQKKTYDSPPSPTLKHVKPEIRDLVAALSFAQHFGSDNEDEMEPSHASTTRNNPLKESPKVIIPKFDTIPKGQEPCTADSSESGYTSNIQNSPRDFELKAAHYVNSLPHNTEMENRKSTSSDLLRNGSQTESDDDSEVSEAPCKSGSDTDYQISDPESPDESFSRLEITKILESPSDIAQRINNKPVQKRTKSKQYSDKISPTEIQKTTLQMLHSPNSPFVEKQAMKNNNRQNSGESETDMKFSHMTEFDNYNIVPEAKPNNHVKIDTVVIDTTKPGSVKTSTETRHLSHKKSTPSFSANLLDLPLLGFRKREFSSVVQSHFTNCLDSVLHIFNVLLFVSSGGVLGVGMWLLLKDFNMNNIAEVFGNNMIQVVIYVAIVGAILALLASTCLCCGIRRDKFGLGFYALIIVAVVIAFASTAVLCMILADKLRGIEFKVNFKDRLTTKYGNTEDALIENEYFTESWDKMQQKFECCGAYGNVNDTTSWAVYKKFSAWYRLPSTNKVTQFVPASCCVANSNLDVCMGSDHYLYGPPVYGPPMDRGFNAKNKNLNTDGCYSAVSSYLQQLVTITAVVTGGLSGLYLIVVMLTWVFCFKRKQDGDYDYSSYEDDVFDEEEEEDEEEENEDSAINNANSESEVTHQASIHRLPSKESSDLKTAIGNEETEADTDRTGVIPFYSDPSINIIDRMSPVDDEEAIDRRDRYERSDKKLDLLFTETIQEEDSNFEDSDTEELNEHHKLW